jgi:hypothetical protein
MASKKGVATTFAVCSTLQIPVTHSAPLPPVCLYLEDALLIASQKYTVQPQGLYAAINRLFALDPNRSTGIPMNPQFRNPPPGENPYWKRDVRRRYPRLSTITQADAVALLEVGSAAAPKQELIGEAGSKQLVAAQEQGTKGLAVAFERNMGLAADVLGPGGMPPMPVAQHPTGAAGQKRYDLESEQAYPDT